MSDICSKGIHLFIRRMDFQSHININKINLEYAAINLEKAIIAMHEGETERKTICN